MQQANSYDPYGAAFTSLGRNKELTSGLARLFGGGGGQFQVDPNAYAFGSQVWE
jgi:hypothetical protein